MADEFYTSLGVTILTDLPGEIKFPKLTSGGTAYWVPENGEITESALTAAMLTMKPKKVCALTVFSNTLAHFTSPNLENLLRRNFTRLLNNKIAPAMLIGSGHSGEPVGLSNMTGINTHAIGTNGGTFDFVQADRMLGTLEDDDADKGNVSYIAHPKVWRKMKQLRVAQFAGDTGGEYSYLPLSMANLSERIGYPINKTTLLPTDLAKGTVTTGLSYVFCGNWSDLLLGFFGGMRIGISDSAGTAFEHDQTKIKIVMEADVQVYHEESFCVCSDADTTGA